MRNFLMMITVLLCGAAIAVPAFADTTYTYTGNPYTTCMGWSVCNGTTPYMSITFNTSMTASQLANLQPLTNITSTVTSFTFDDHAGDVLDQTSASNNFAFFIATGSDGLPTSWTLDAFNVFGTISLYSCDNGICVGPGLDRTQFNNLTPIGYSQSVGTWVSPTTVVSTPEPGTTSLTLSGLGFLGLLMVFRKRQALGLSAGQT